MGTPEVSHLGELQALLAAFKLERIVYLSLAGASFLVQMGLLAWLIQKEVSTDSYLYAMVAGPSGVLVVTMGRVLKMWTDCLQFLRMSSKARSQ